MVLATVPLARQALLKMAMTVRSVSRSRRPRLRARSALTAASAMARHVHPVLLFAKRAVAQRRAIALSVALDSTHSMATVSLRMETVYAKAPTSSQTTTNTNAIAVLRSARPARSPTSTLPPRSISCSALVACQALSYHRDNAWRAVRWAHSLVRRIT